MERVAQQQPCPLALIGCRAAGLHLQQVGADQGDRIGFRHVLVPSYLAGAPASSVGARPVMPLEAEGDRLQYVGGASAACVVARARARLKLSAGLLAVAQRVVGAE